MRGLGLGPWLGQQGGTGGGGATYLPTANLKAARGLKRMVAGYNGPLFNIVRTGGSGGNFDVYCKAGSDDPDWASISAHWTDGWSALRFGPRYDQSGNGVTETVTGSGLLLDLSLGASAPNSLGAVSSTGSRWDSSIALDRQNVTVIQSVQARAAMESNQAFWQIGNGTTLLSSLYLGNGVIAPVYYNGTNFNFTSANPGPYAVRSNPSTVGWSSSPSEQRLYIRETSIAKAADTSSTGTTFSEPWANISGGWYGNMRHFGSAIYSALNSTDTQAAISAMNAIFSIPTSFTSRVVLRGDSISAGLQTTYQRTLPWYFLQNKPAIEIFNFGQSSAQMATQYASRASDVEKVYTTSYGAGKCVIIIQGGTNDIGLGAGTDTTLYSTLSNFVSAEKTIGFKVVVSDLLPRSDSAWTGTMEGYRTAYNTKVLANTAGADATVDIADVATVMGALTAPADTTAPKKYAEAPLGLHPTDYGYSQYYAEYLAAGPIAAL